MWCSSQISRRESFYAIVSHFVSHFSTESSHDLHMWRHYCLVGMPSSVYLDPPGPSISPSRWCSFCLKKFLHVQVPLGCVKTAFVTQGLGSREFVKTMEVSISIRAYEVFLAFLFFFFFWGGGGHFSQNTLPYWESIIALLKLHSSNTVKAYQHTIYIYYILKHALRWLIKAVFFARNI